MQLKLVIIFLFLFLMNSSNLLAADKLAADFLTFEQAGELALENSHTLASQEQIVESAKQEAKAQKVKRYPFLNFEAQSMFVSKIGRFQIPTLGINREVGDHINWSVGPALEWTVWDTGQITKKAKSLEKTTAAQTQNLDYYGRQVLFSARSSYIDVQLAKEQVRLVKDALNLAQAQYSDILEKKKAGTADLLDLTVAHQEVVDRQRDLEEAFGNLALAKRALVATLGYDPQAESVDALEVQQINQVLNVLLPQANTQVDIEAHPQVQALADQQQAYELAAKSSSARHWPKIDMKGTSTFEYPNLGENITIQQNKLLLNLHLPIFDWGMISKESRSNKFQAYSTQEQKKQTMLDLERTTAEIRQRIKTLKGLRIANIKAINDAVEVARLTYNSYQAGRVIFLDVQRANVKALSIKVDSAQTDAELARQISQLLALAQSKEPSND
ncbi:MAG: TolC family protein [Pseudomonadota bacterium]